MPSCSTFRSKFSLWPHFCYWFIWVGFVALSFKTATAYPEFINAKFQLNFWQLAGFFWLITTAWQFITSLRFTKLEIIAFTIFTTLLFFICLGFYFFTLSHDLNAVLITFHLHSSVLINLTIVLATLAIWLLFTSSFTWKWLPFPYFLIIIILCLYFAHLPLFILISGEDHLLEWSSFIILVLGFGFALFGLIKSCLSRHSPLPLIFGFFALVLFFLAGEEISWGQRVTNNSPTLLFASNLQQETNFHNLNGLQQTMSLGYTLLGFWGSFIFLLNVFPSTKNWLHHQSSIRQFPLHYFIIHWSYATWFFPIFIYGLNLLLTGPMYYKTWEEAAELLCWCGLALHLAALTKIPSPQQAR